MAGRPKGSKNKRPLTEERREKIAERIRTGLIVTHLENHVIGKQSMRPSQVAAGLGLLRKTIPDLSATKHTGADGGPLQVIINAMDSDL